MLPCVSSDPAAIRADSSLPSLLLREKSGVHLFLNEDDNHELELLLSDPVDLEVSGSESELWVSTTSDKPCLLRLRNGNT